MRDTDEGSSTYTYLAASATWPNDQVRDRLRGLGRLLLLAVTYLRPGIPIDYVPPVSAKGRSWPHGLDQPRSRTHS
jgi:hypothetical protein